eukprot:1655768-Rhodomonas_salina.1
MRVCMCGLTCARAPPEVLEDRLHVLGHVRRRPPHVAATHTQAVQALRIGPRASGIGLDGSGIEHRASSIGFQVSGIWGWEIGHRGSIIKHPALGSEHKTSSIAHWDRIKGFGGGRADVRAAPMVAASHWSRGRSSMSITSSVPARTCVWFAAMVLRQDERVEDGVSELSELSE